MELKALTSAKPFNFSGQKSPFFEETIAYPSRV
jgi:hypothetical protein